MKKNLLFIFLIISYFIILPENSKANMINKTSIELVENNVLIRQKTLECKGLTTVSMVESYDIFFRKYSTNKQNQKINRLKGGFMHYIFFEGNSIGKLNYCIRWHPKSKANEYERDSIAFNKIITKNSIESLLTYIDKYPSSKFILNALSIIDKIKVDSILKENNPNNLYSFIKSNHHNSYISQVWQKIFDISNFDNYKSISEFESLYSPLPFFLEKKLIDKKIKVNTVKITYKKVYTKNGKYINNLVPKLGYFMLPNFQINAIPQSNIINHINKKINQFNYQEIDFKNASKLYQGSLETHLPILDTTYIYNDNGVLAVVTNSDYGGYGNYFRTENISYNLNTYDHDTITLENSFNYKELIAKTNQTYINRVVMLQKSCLEEPIHNLNNQLPNKFHKLSTLSYSDDDEQIDRDYLNSLVSSKYSNNLYKHFYITSDSIFFFPNIQVNTLSEMSNSFQLGGNYVGFSVDELSQFIKYDGKLKLFLESRKYNKNKSTTKSSLSNLSESELIRNNLKQNLQDNWLKYVNEIENIKSIIKKYSIQSPFEKDIDYVDRIKELEILLPYFKEKNQISYANNLLTENEKQLYPSNTVDISLNQNLYNPNTEKWDIQYIENLTIKNLRKTTINVPPKVAEYINNGINKGIQVQGLYQLKFHLSPILRKIQFVENSKVLYSFDSEYFCIDTNSYFKSDEAVKYKISPQYQYCAFIQDDEFCDRANPNSYSYNKENSKSIHDTNLFLHEQSDSYGTNSYTGKVLTILDDKNGINKPINLFLALNVKLYAFNFDCVGERLFIATSNGLFIFEISTLKFYKVEYTKKYNFSVSHQLLPYIALINLTDDEKRIENICLFDYINNKLIQKIVVKNELLIKDLKSCKWKYDGSFELELGVINNNTEMRNMEVNFIEGKIK